MTLRTIALLSAATLALTACGKKTENDTANSSAMAGSNMEAPANDSAVAPVAPGQAFANAAAASDAFEIASSRLALTNASSKSVKAYAQKMIDAHTASTAKLKTVAGATVTPDPTLNADQQAKVDALKGKTGADFDTAYIADQTAGHQQTLDALKGYAATGGVPALKSFATSMIPTVAAHLNMAKGLKA